MRRANRRIVTLLCAAFCGANFVCLIGATLWYASTRPTAPNVAAGRTYAFHEKNSATVYLTASETTGLSLLPLGFIVGFASLGIAIVTEPKEYTSLGTIKEAVYTKRDNLMLLAFAVSYIVIVVVAGPSIANFAVSHGIVLDFGSFG